MSNDRYFAEVHWQRNGQDFAGNQYSRRHVWRFDEGLEVPASSSPHVVPVPLSVADAVDPEEAFVASLSSCHMLFFLAFAAKRGFVVDRYTDQAEGVLGKNATGRVALVEVTLRPEIIWSGDKLPDAAMVDKLHHDAHERCYIANSVNCPVHIVAR
ncbi:OsmC family protein [Chitinibacteraceae bacterium HSL-7]